MINSLLVTSTGGTVGTLILKMLREALPESARIVAADSCVDMTGSKFVNAAAILPLANDPTYSDKLRALISVHDIEAVLPLSEEECLAISQMYEEECLGAQYLGMPFSTLKIITHKIDCAAFLTSAGIDVPKCIPLTDAASLEDSLTNLGYPNTSVVLKPISGRGSRGFRVIRANIDRLAEFSRKGGPIFMDLEQTQQVFASQEDTLREFFLMEFLPGKSVSVDLVAWQGKALGIFPHFRLGYEWGFVDHAKIMRDLEIEAYCAKVIAALGMHGMCNIEVGYRADGTLSLIEVNGRTSATAAQNILVGANCFELLLQAQVGDTSPFTFEKPVAYRTLTEFDAVSPTPSNPI